MLAWPHIPVVQDLESPGSLGSMKALSCEAGARRDPRSATPRVSRTGGQWRQPLRRHASFGCAASPPVTSSVASVPAAPSAAAPAPPSSAVAGGGCSPAWSSSPSIDSGI